MPPFLYGSHNCGQSQTGPINKATPEHSTTSELDPVCQTALSLYFRVTERRLLDVWGRISAYSTYNKNVQMDSPPENHCGLNGDSKSRPCTLYEELWIGFHQPAASA